MPGTRPRRTAKNLMSSWVSLGPEVASAVRDSSAAPAAPAPSPPDLDPTKAPRNPRGASRLLLLDEQLVRGATGAVRRNMLAAACGCGAAYSLGGRPFSSPAPKPPTHIHSHTRALAHTHTHTHAHAHTHTPGRLQVWEGRSGRAGGLWDGAAGARTRGYAPVPGLRSCPLAQEGVELNLVKTTLV